MERNNPDEEITFKDLIFKAKEWYAYLRSKYLLILVFAIAGAMLGLAYSYSKKSVYTANLSFALEDEKSSGGLGGALGLANQLGIDMGGSGGGAFSGTNLEELFKSRSMVEKTFLSSATVNGKDITLAEMYIDYNGWRENWNENEKLKNIVYSTNADRAKFSRVQDSILGCMYQNISASGLKVSQKDTKSSIIMIEVKSQNEIFSKLFTEHLASVVSDFYIYTKSKKSRTNMLILKKQADSIRMELNGAITGVAVANDNTFNLNPALNVRRVPSSKRQVDVQANSAILAELVKQTELAKVTLRKDTPLIQIIDKPILPLKKEKFGKLKGIVFGGFLAVFFIVFFLTLKRIFSNLLK